MMTSTTVLSDRSPDGVPRFAIGCMRLSTDASATTNERSACCTPRSMRASRSSTRPTRTAWTPRDTGHNERLIARALATWAGDRSAFASRPKAVSPGPRAVGADGRARDLTAACEASRRALGVDAFTSISCTRLIRACRSRRACARCTRLQRRGLIESIGLCNVTVGQIEEARRITEIDAVQVELSLWKDDNVLNGVVDYCTRTAFRCSPTARSGAVQRAVGSPPIRCSPRLAAEHGATPSEIALAWLMDLSARHRPLAGATRVETARRSRAPRRSSSTMTIGRGSTSDSQPAERSRRRRGAPVPAAALPATEKSC